MNNLRTDDYYGRPIDGLMRTHCMHIINDHGHRCNRIKHQTLKGLLLCAWHDISALRTAHANGKVS